METNNPDFSEEEFLKQTKRIIDSMQDEEANREFQSIMKDSNFSEKNFRKCLLKLDDDDNDAKYLLKFDKIQDEAEHQRIQRLYEDFKKLPNNKISRITNTKGETIKITESSFENSLFYGISFIDFQKE